MKLSSKTITAIKMFIDLGEQYENGFISLKDIAQRKDLSKKFLEQIMPSYKNAGLLLGNRGNQGGYKLAKSPNQISLKDIIYIQENSLAKELVNYASIDSAIEKADELLDDYFSKISLAKLIEDQRESYLNDYSI
ncbi:MAG: Rrf2 family transcriptional regulator [Bacilli bacterium]|nr:Rrf2 family transcriptional regulator [Bacilli bacterium]